MIVNLSGDADKPPPLKQQPKHAQPIEVDHVRAF